MTSWMVRNRSGRAPSRAGVARVGVLVAVLLVSTATYVAAKAARVYLDYRAFRSEMTVQGQLAQRLGDDTIRVALQRKARELELPAAARDLQIRRFTDTREIRIECTYEEVVEIPFYRFTVTLHPEVMVPY